ncbi:hypothetical protein H5410_053870 [Solanum commersonii]|uniref:Uncharacterized protein n=1 Tax=Solanum commersonii TaxID=4109 RepID=A0A9J5X518_SOLCO|nr:hypothetical protein H5410_053870 [Solanum commersonii]
MVPSRGALLWLYKSYEKPQNYEGKTLYPGSAEMVPPTFIALSNSTSMEYKGLHINLWRIQATKSERGWEIQGRFTQKQMEFRRRDAEQQMLVGSFPSDGIPTPNGVRKWAQQMWR